MSEQESNVSRQYLNKSNIHKVESPILAIDYGTKNIGLAITDQKGVVAQPLSIIRVKDGNFENFCLELKKIIEKYNVKTLVLGIPQAFKKAHLQNIPYVLKFQDLIQKVTKKEVFLYDESYSTSNAYEVLQNQGENMKKSKQKIDKIAATYFLQELIDFKNRTND